MFRIILLACFSLTTSGLHAQFARLTFSVPDSMAGFFYVNQVRLNNAPCTALTLDRTPSGKQNIQMTLLQRDSLFIQQELDLKPGVHYRLEPRFSRTRWSIITVSESPVILTEIDAPALAIVPEEQPATETGNCPNTLTSDQINSLKQAVKEVPFESKKLHFLKEALAGKCLRTEQLRYLITLLDMEENKLHLIEYSASLLSDPEKLSVLENDFYFEKNRQSLRLLYTQTPAP